MEPNMVQVQQAGWFDRFKANLNIDTLMQKIRLSQGKLIEMGVYLGIGFLVGFLLKKYAQYVVVFILLVTGLVVLQQLGVLYITVNWIRVQDLFGIQPATVGTDVVNSYFEWVKVNIWLVLSFSVGFFLGLKVG